ncbi:sigma-54 interaction domain-containing protein [Ectothiorhodospira haloalkaliphila]|nr:sigma-54 dependent transcriptional regulator [Ectothiorhodospira haloalkaliphila]
MDTMTGNVMLIGWHGHECRKLERWLREQGLVFNHARPEDVVAAERASVALVRESGAEAPGLPRLEAVMESSRAQPTILVGDGLAPEQVILAARLGALDVLTEPLCRDQLRKAIGEARMSCLDSTDADVLREDCPAILGTSSQILSVYKQLGVAASNDLNVLLTGETGVGKEVSAHCIHRHSVRAHRPYVAINCTAIPEGLLEAEMFGYARGAYTNAIADGVGRIESAHGGTLLLDEVGDMPMAFQAKLLRFLEDRQFHRLGDSEPRAADVRVIAATNRDLEQDVEAGRFRRDLYYRLSQLPIHIPALRERTDDVRALLRAFVSDANLKLGLHITDISEQAQAEAVAYHWPGNVRELKNIVYQAAVRTRVGRIDHLPLFPGTHTQGGDDTCSETALAALIQRAIAGGRVREMLEEVEGLALQSLLEAFAGNRSRVAEELGMSRNTLRARLRLHGLQVESQ